MRCLALTCLALLLALPAAAQDQASIFKAFAGAGGVWYGGQVSQTPNDFELGGSARASLSPHISAVGSTYYALDNKYVHSAAGVRFTATDVDNPNFSVGLGIQYHLSSKPEIRPEEWAPDVTVGWVPLPQQAKALSLILRSHYGLDSKQAWVFALVNVAVWQGGKP